MMGRKRFEEKLFHSLSLAKLVPEGHLLRRLDEAIDLSFVRQLCKAYYSHTGQPSVDPVVIFKMMLLGYLYGIRSERRLAEECLMHMGFRWYLGYDVDEKTPDHSVLSKARKRYGKKVFEEFFERVLKKCVEMELVGGETLFADSTLVRANASKRSIVKRSQLLKVEREGREYVEEMFREEEGQKAKKRQRRNDREVSRTDPDSAIVKRSRKGTQLAYKKHFTVDGKKRVITAIEVTHGVVDDASQVSKLLEAQPMVPKQFCADSHYGAASVYGKLADEGIQAVIPRRRFEGQKAKADRISYREFAYDSQRDVYVCPQGKELKRTTYDPRWDRDYYRPLRSDCRDCAIRENCCSANAVRCLTRPRRQEAIDEALEYLKSDQGQAIFALRSTTAEGIVSEAKGCHGLGRAQFRGLEKVGIQALMTASVQNLKRIMATLSNLPSAGPFSSLRGAIYQALRAIRQTLLRNLSCSPV